jgi:hypothetical protein
MELTSGRLQATLVAGKILGTHEASAMLSGGLTTIGHGYQIEKAISETAKTDTEITKDLPGFPWRAVPLLMFSGPT